MSSEHLWPPERDCRWLWVSDKGADDFLAEWLPLIMEAAVC